MAEPGAYQSDGDAAGVVRPSAASVIAELWSEREQANAAPPVPRLPQRGDERRRRQPLGAYDDGTGSNTKAVLAVVVVALLLGAGLGVFLNSQGFGRTSQAKFVSKADAVCGPANGPVTALAKPTSYPELATAAGTLVKSTDTQLGGLRKISAPGGPDGAKVGAFLVAMTGTNQAGRSLQDAAGRADDAATAAATNEVRRSWADASTKAKELGFSACAAGLQPGLDAVASGASAIVKTAFVAKADTICRAGARAMEAVRAPRQSRDPRIQNRELSRYLGEMLAISGRMTVELKALPVPPGDEGVVGQMTSEMDKFDAKGREARDAAVDNDSSRFSAVVEEMDLLTTATDAKLDAYGLTTCGSNFGSR